MTVELLYIILENSRAFDNVSGVLYGWFPGYELSLSLPYASLPLEFLSNSYSRSIQKDITVGGFLYFEYTTISLLKFPNTWILMWLYWKQIFYPYINLMVMHYI